MNHEAAVATGKVGLPFFGLAVAEILPRVQLVAYTLTAIYTALMIGHFVWTKMIRPNLRK